MTAQPAVVTEEWLARWAEASSQCWAKPGYCCRSCRVEALVPPEAADSPCAVPTAEGMTERPAPRSGDLRAGTGQIRPDSTTTEPRRAA